MLGMRPGPLWAPSFNTGRYSPSKLRNVNTSLQNLTLFVLSWWHFMGETEMDRYQS